MTTFDRVVDGMVNSLRDAAIDANVDLSGLTYENFNTYLDDAFEDGGETRCEKFTDLAWEYARSKGATFDSEPHHRYCHVCIKTAIRMIQMLYK